MARFKAFLEFPADITQRKIMESQLIASKHATDFYLEKVLLSSPSNIYWLDGEKAALLVVMISRLMRRAEQPAHDILAPPFLI